MRTPEVVYDVHAATESFDADLGVSSLEQLCLEQIEHGLMMMTDADRTHIPCAHEATRGQYELADCELMPTPAAAAAAANWS